MSLKSVLKWTVTVGVVAAAGYAGYHYWWKGGGASGTQEIKNDVVTAKAVRGPLRQIVQCTGPIYSNLDVDIKCRASGEIRELPFNISDQVKKGDLLMALDPVDQQRSVDQQTASVAAAQAKLDSAKAALAVAEQTVVANRLKAEAAIELAQRQVADAGAKAKREGQLLEKKFSSPELVETAQTTAALAEQNVKAARAQLEEVKAQQLDLESKKQDIALCSAQLDQAKIALNLAQLQLSYTKIEAPIDGVISTRPVQIGNIISSGISNVGGGTTVMTLSDLSHIYCYASVDESDIGFVQVGQPAEITADSFPRKRFTGEVIRIATTGVNVQNVITFQVRIEITSENKVLLKPQMSTNVTIVIADKPDVLQIPANCVIRKKGGDVVKVKSGGAPEGEERSVEIGISDGRSTEIVSGLNEGDEVVEQNPADETRWAGGGQNPAQSKARQQMMMMRMGGGGGAPGGRH
jgi:HlyD family secretion protein